MWDLDLAISDFAFLKHCSVITVIKKSILPQAAQALVVRSYYYYFFCIFMRTFREIVTAVVYCYITTEFHYAKRDSGHLAFGGVMLQRFEFTKVCVRNFSRNFDIFAIKMVYLNALLSFLLSSCFSARSVTF